MHFQPIIDLATDELDGFEALMRWHHPELGSVSPLDFIPIAEETGLIVESGAWLLRESARPSSPRGPPSAGPAPGSCTSRSTSRSASCATARWSTIVRDVLAEHRAAGRVRSGWRSPSPA